MPEFSLACCLLASLATPAFAAPETILVSVSSAGVQGNAKSFDGNIAPGGNYIAFASYATNLVAGDTNNSTDIFVRDIIGGKTRRVSISNTGTQAESTILPVTGYVERLNSNPSISSSTHYVAFRSYAKNLVSGDSNNVADIFVRDLFAGKTKRVSISSTGIQANSNSLIQGSSLLSGSYDPMISDNGRYVVFTSVADNLVEGDTNNAPDVFVHDLMTSETKRVSVDSTGIEAINSGYKPVISATGRYIAFNSTSPNLVAGFNEFTPNVFVHDLQTASTVAVTSAHNNGFSHDEYQVYSISADGRFVGLNLTYFEPRFPSFPGGEVIDRTTGAIMGNSGDSPLVSADGHYVIASIVAAGAFGAPVRITNLFSSLVENVSVSSTGNPVFNCLHNDLSKTGQYVAFTCGQSNLVANDINNTDDVFVCRRY